MLKSLSPHPYYPHHHHSLPGLQHLASCSSDRTIRLWETASFKSSNHKCSRTNVELDHATSLSFSEDGRCVPRSPRPSPLRRCLGR